MLITALARILLYIAVTLAPILTISPPTLILRPAFFPLCPVSTGLQANQIGL